MNCWMPRCAALALCTMLMVKVLGNAWAQECGDLDNSGQIAATDALLLLNKAVDQPVPDLVCPLSVGLPSTGQTTCYDGNGEVIDCAGTGQDGELQKGVARSFSDNGDGTITDNATGLVWEKLSDDDSIHDWNNVYAWTDAFAAKIATLNSTSFAGHSDWRVPNLVELESLRNVAASDPAAYSTFTTGCVAACTVLTCSCSGSSYYWSSTTVALYPSLAWYVYGFDGYAGGINRQDSLHVRAVRGGL